ncbi:Hypothetical predicted protein [Podarcis lilfordi]|uniref:Uncharacterized protein n=1 Tax=Podarcis lilfordi TaxID=74358 RepID=A0AA35NT58_9SAUR|nr:Hypothetical predicted protein [Podarcis lilfordi]
MGYFQVCRLRMRRSTNCSERVHTALCPASFLASDRASRMDPGRKTRYDCTTMYRKVMAEVWRTMLAASLGADENCVSTNEGPVGIVPISCKHLKCSPLIHETTAVEAATCYPVLDPKLPPFGTWTCWQGGLELQTGKKFNSVFI